MTEARCQSLSLAQGREALSAVPAARPPRHESFDELRERHVPQALPERDLAIDRVGDPELTARSITSGTPARPAVGVGSIVRLILNGNLASPVVSSSFKSALGEQKQVRRHHGCGPHGWRPHASFAQSVTSLTG
jgi:hypothetical protein